MSVRRRFTNNTGTSVTTLRFRVIDITTLDSPNVCGGCVQADVRVLSRSGSFNVTLTDGSTVPVNGTIVENSALPDSTIGGGLNTTLSSGVVSLAQPLASGATMNLARSKLRGIRRG